MTGDGYACIEVVLHEEARTEALAYIHAAMTKRFGCTPPPTPGIILVARQNAEIAGSMSLESRSEGVPLALEERYCFEPSALPYPLDHRCVQGARWNVNSWHLAEPLFRSACRLAHMLGKRYMIIEAKSSVVRRFRQFGIGFAQVEGAALRIETVRAALGEDGMKYFITPPPPTLYMLDLDTVLA